MMRVLIGLLIRRKPFSIIGILDIIVYVLYLEVAHIKGGTILLTSVILTTGLIVLYVGVIFSKNINKIEAFLENVLPQGIRKFLPQNRE